MREAVYVDLCPHRGRTSVARACHDLAPHDARARAERTEYRLVRLRARRGVTPRNTIMCRVSGDRRDAHQSPESLLLLQQCAEYYFYYSSVVASYHSTRRRTGERIAERSAKRSAPSGARGFRFEARIGEEGRMVRGERRSPSRCAIRARRRPKGFTMAANQRLRRRSSSFRSAVAPASRSSSAGSVAPTAA